MSFQQAFADYLHATNVAGSGKASSYLRALELLQKMIHANPCGFEDCRNLWTVDSLSRLEELRQFTLHEAKLGADSAWCRDDLPRSYLRNGYCSAALRSLQHFLVQHRYEQQLLRILEDKKGHEEQLLQQLPDGPDLPPFLAEGAESLREVKARINQGAFRTVILRNYGSTCCLTGLNVAALNRASHIIPWAERKETRLDPRNGLCLSATYDAAFDRKLITFDCDYRLVLSRTLRDHVPNESFRAYFLSREGQRMALPRAYPPLPAYLAHHREKGDF